MRADEERTKPLTDYYERDGRLLRVPATGTPEEVLERSLKGHFLDRVPIQVFEGGARQLPEGVTPRVVRRGERWEVER
jgi:hypothetical protein